MPIGTDLFTTTNDQVRLFENQIHYRLNINIYRKLLKAIYVPLGATLPVLEREICDEVNLSLNSECDLRLANVAPLLDAVLRESVMLTAPLAAAIAAMTAVHDALADFEPRLLDQIREELNVDPQAKA